MKIKYEMLLKQLESMIEDEDNTIGILSNASALLNQTLEDINWVGFYLYDPKKDILVLGPFQGKVACMRIPMNKGVCGTAAYQRSTLLVDDVHCFDGHIACDTASNAEIVVPIIIHDALYGVLDIDSPTKNRFDALDQEYLEKFVTILNQKLD